MIADNVNPFDANAQVEGYVDAFTWGAGILVLKGEFRGIRLMPEFLRSRLATGLPAS